MGQTVPQHQELQLYKGKQNTPVHPKLAATSDLGKALPVPLEYLSRSIMYQRYWSIFHGFDSHFGEPREVHKPSIIEIHNINRR